MVQLKRFGIAATAAAAMSFVALSAAPQYRGEAAPPAPAAAQQQQQNVPTPRTADGHPDLSGVWGGGEGGGGAKPEDLPCEERDSQHMVTHERG